MNKNIQSYDFVVNMSSYKSEDNELIFLQKGLNFSPIPNEPNMFEFTQNLQRFFRSLRLSSHFNNEDEEAQNLDKTHLSSLYYTVNKGHSKY